MGAGVPPVRGGPPAPLRPREVARYLLRLDDEALGILAATAVEVETARPPDVTPAVMDRLQRDVIAYPERFARGPRAVPAPPAPRRRRGRRSALAVVIAAIVVVVLATAALLLTPMTGRAAEVGAVRPSAGLAVRLEPLASGLGAPVFVTGDRSGGLLVVEQAGRVMRLGPDGALEDPPFLDIRERVSAGGERGLLGLALHPRAGDARVFVHYTRRPDGASVVASVSVREGLADPTGESVLLVVGQPFANHNGGMIAFDRDGYLLVGLGDGGGAGDPEGHGQDPSTLLGSILRLDVDRADPGLAYGVPADNGFVDHGGARPEVHAMGLRNPWRFSVDPATGDVWIGDVGQGRWEEVDRLPGGARGIDFGWNQVEGPECYLAGCDLAAHEPPVAAYSHDLGCSVIGGLVYRGTAQPALEGIYLFGDYCSGTIWAARAVDLASRSAAPLAVGGLAGPLVSFGTDDAGEPLVVDHGGRILRLVAAVGP